MKKKHHPPQHQLRRQFAPPMLCLAVLALAICAWTWILGCEPIFSQSSELSKGEGATGIVGGQPTEYATWRGAVGIMIPLGQTRYSICTATLIDPEVILSAGHCVYLPAQGIDVLNSPGKVIIVGGANMEIHYSVAAEVIKHPDWNGDIYSPDRVDLSMIRLATPITHIPPYPVDDQPLEVGMKGVIVGYGNSSDTSGAGVHRFGETTVLTLDETEFELGNPAGTCLGDSGGPLFVDRGDGDWVVAGVSSYGVGYGCPAMDSSWDVYILVHRDWIGTVLEKLTGRPLPDVIIDSDSDSATGQESDSETSNADTGISDSDTRETDSADTDSANDLDSEIVEDGDTDDSSAPVPDSDADYPEDPIPSLDSDISFDPDGLGTGLLADGGYVTMPFGMSQKNPVDCGCRLSGVQSRPGLTAILLRALQ